LAEIRINNDGSLGEYEHQVLSILQSSADRVNFGNVATAKGGTQKELSVHRLFRCMSVLYAHGGVMTCDEIARETGASAVVAQTPMATEVLSRYTGKRIAPNNVNKILRPVPALAKRSEMSGGAAIRVQYSITNSGRAYIRLMRTHAERGRRP
jgi:hypothetical protein